MILHQAGPPLQSRERGAGAAVRGALLADPARDPRLARHAAGARQLGGAQEQTPLLRRRGEFRNRERWEMSLLGQIFFTLWSNQGVKSEEMAILCCSLLGKIQTYPREL